MENDDAAQPAPQRPLIEWIVGGLSALLVVGLAAYLAFTAVFHDVRPPDLRATIERVEPSGGGTQVHVKIANHGDKAASAVIVRARALRDGESDTTEIEFDYVAGHSVRRGAFIFPQPISLSDLGIEVGGYVEP